MEARALYGTEAPPAPRQRLVAGPVSLGLEGGNLRHLRHGETELIRAVAFLVRDRDWGTLAPEIRDLRIEAGDETRVSYTAHFDSGVARLAVDVTIRLTAGLLRFAAEARATGDFETNRTGFTVLHPIEGVAGAPLRVEHGDAPAEDSQFPAMIAPWQPFQNITGLIHQAGGLRVTCRFEGDVFEMEDQRQWGDASYKTYVRPLALPWPYCIADGSVIRQAVEIRWEAAAPAAPVAPLRCVAPDAVFPETALLLDAAEAARPDAPALIRQIGPQRLLCHLDAAAGDGLTELRAFADLQARLPECTFDLELIARCRPDGDLTAEFTGHAADLARAGFHPASVMVCPAVDRQSTPPGSDWPACPPLEAIHRAARAAFAGIALGGGMASFFPELNRKRPPVALLDFVTHGLCPIVHAADDLSVMETLETVPHIMLSAQAIAAGAARRLGPSTLAMRQNPYGSRTLPNPGRGRVCMTDDDPRQDGAFAAAWTLGLATQIAPAGLQVWTPAGLTGPRGLFHTDARPRPLAAVVARLAGLAGQPVNAAELGGGRSRLACGARVLEANLTATAQGPLPPYGWREDLQAGRQGTMP